MILKYWIKFDQCKPILLFANNFEQLMKLVKYHAELQNQSFEWLIREYES